MAIVHSPSAISSGLTLHLDSMNRSSYPGYGDTWYDISGNGNHGTLNAFTGTGAGTASGFDTTTGYMMFDRHVGASDGAVNNHVTVPSSTSLAECLSQNGVTIEIVLKMTSYTCTALTRWAGPWEIYYCSSLVHRTIGTNGSDGNSGYAASNKLNVFHHITATHNGTTRTLYVNGSSVLSDTNTVTGQNSSATMGIGAYSNGNYAFVGAMPIFRVWNRVLSTTEISDSWLRTKRRFGL